MLQRDGPTETAEQYRSLHARDVSTPTRDKRELKLVRGLRLSINARTVQQRLLSYDRMAR